MEIEAPFPFIFIHCYEQHRPEGRTAALTTTTEGVCCAVLLPVCIHIYTYYSVVCSHCAFNCLLIAMEESTLRVEGQM